MSDKNSQIGQISASQEAGAIKHGEVCAKTKGGFKGWLTMALCCAAPLLLVAAVALFGISLGALAGGLVSIAAILACPVAMYLMMRIMNKK